MVAIASFLGFCRVNEERKEEEGEECRLLLFVD